MRFSISTAFQPVDHLPALARAADELGYHSMAVPDHVVDLEELATPYPYTADGARRWDHDAAWPDPWVLIGALAAVTTRLRFFTSVYVPAIRSPFQVAKSVGTAAVLSGNRVSLGVGIGWCREEFELLGQDFTTRGRRTDEALALMARAVAAGLDRVRGRVLRRAAAGHGADAHRARSRSSSAASPRSPSAGPPATTAGSATSTRPTRRSRTPPGWRRYAGRSAPRATSRSSSR